MSIGGENLHKWLRINFIGEAGIDAGKLDRPAPSLYWLIRLYAAPIFSVTLPL